MVDLPKPKTIVVITFAKCTPTWEEIKENKSKKINANQFGEKIK